MDKKTFFSTFFPFFTLDLVPVLKKNGKKVEKNVFLSIYPGKSEFLRPKTFFKNFIYAFKTLVK